MLRCCVWRAYVCRVVRAKRTTQRTATCNDLTMSRAAPIVRQTTMGIRPPPTSPQQASPTPAPQPIAATRGLSTTSLPRPPTKARPEVGADGKLAKKALVEQYTPFVRSIAAKVKKSVSKNIEFDDLVAYGMTGLLEAAERYDPKVGANFMTFSYYRIRGAIYDGLRGMGWVSRSEYQKIRFEERANTYLENISNREIVGGESSRSVEDNVEELANQVSQLVTIYVTSLEAMENLQVEDKEKQPIDERLVDVELRQYLREALLRLPDADREIVTLYYFKEMSLQDVGVKLGLSKSWTSRRHAQAIDKLTQVLQALMQEQKQPVGKKPSVRASNRS
jgi:RNA polymerase sigma factor FliA